MPEKELPKFVRIDSCYATWHENTENWADMIEIGIGNIQLSKDTVFHLLRFELGWSIYTVRTIKVRDCIQGFTKQF